MSEKIFNKTLLELYALANIKKLGLPFSHESVVFTLQKSSVSHIPSYFNDVEQSKTFRASEQKNHAVRITPDFIVYGLKNNYIIDTKGKETKYFKLKWKMLRMHLAQRSSGNYMLFLPKTKRNVRRVIEIIEDEERKYINELKNLQEASYVDVSKT